MNCRDFEELLLMSKELRDALELTDVPDYSTLNRMYHRFRASHLDKMNETLLSTLDNGSPVQEQSSPRAGDHTRFDRVSSDECQRLLSDPLDPPDPPRQAVQTLAERCVCCRCQQPDSQMILAVAHGVGPSNDAPHLSTLKRRERRARRYGKPDEGGRPICVTLADSAFDSLFDSRTVGPRDIVPPIRRGGSLKAPERTVRADLVSHARLDSLFGQRWKNETVNSVVKRKFGDAVMR